MSTGCPTAPRTRQRKRLLGLEAAGLGARMLHPHVNEKRLHSLRGIAMEVATIIFSILTALQLEDCHKKEVEHRLAVQARRALRDELIGNRERVYGMVLENLRRLQYAKDVDANHGAGDGMMGINITSITAS